MPKLLNLTPSPRARHLVAFWLICASNLAHSADQTLPVVTVTGAMASPVDPLQRQGRALMERQNTATDTTDLLRGLPGVSAYGAGGLSALPVLRGLGDDRLNVRVNGMELQSACPNHMNSALSYIAPSDVASVRIQAGVTPVSAGGDNIGGSIQVDSAPPKFAAAGESATSSGEARLFHRSNGQVRGSALKTTLSAADWSMSYSGSNAQAHNFRAAKAFKPAQPGTEGGRTIPGDEVGSSAYHFVNHDLGWAWRHERHLLRLNVGQQHVLYEGFPNQRMDMTGNRNQTVNLRYGSEWAWGDVSASLSRQRTRHRMDMGPDRYQYGTGMPMLTLAHTDAGSVSVGLPLGEDDRLQSGLEYQRYSLYDWWPAVGGSMGPEAFWNIDNGQRNRLGIYTEWLHRWHPAWQSTLGVRHERVESDASPVQGYDNGLQALWGSEAAAFNAGNHRRTDNNWDLSAQLTHTPDEWHAAALGYARKTRSPSLYQRYPWSTQAMAALMNNFVGDGNGYIGQENLRPEVAHTVNLSGQGRSREPQAWQWRTNVYVTHIQNHIDAQRCGFGQCGAANITATQQFVLLQYTNQTARIVGMDVSGRALLSRSDSGGRVDVQGVLNLLRGTNTDTHQPLYNMAPANATLGISHQDGGWTHTAEWQVSAGKHRVSAIRNEVPTSGYSLVNLRSSRDWTRVRLDLGIDNVFNRFYRQPLGGAYVGQGPSMTSRGVPWGQVVPGPARSLSAALTLRY